MDKAKITISTQGVRGGEISDHKPIGWICIAVDDIGGWRNKRIDIDAFKGLGNNYTNRETPELRVWSDAKVVFQGTYSELIKCLELGVTLNNTLKEKKK